MSLERDWDSIRPDRFRAVEAGMGVLRVTLLFGSAAVALALGGAGTASAEQVKVGFSPEAYPPFYVQDASGQ
ncbi:MAG: hypothetical protein J0J15_31450, partial [Mesorhizobium sp.]|nr:hypothetical protein [Mesorhizobium sp.]